MAHIEENDNLCLSVSKGESQVPLNGTQSRTHTRIIEPIIDCVASIRDKFQAGSILGSIFTLVMVSLGTGLLGLPSAIQQSGIVWGIIQLAVCGVINFYSLLTAVRCAAIHKASSYQELAEKTFGKKFRNFVNIVFFCGGVGTALVYFQAVTLLIQVFISSVSTNPEVLNWVNGDWSQRIIPLGIGTLFVLPLSIPKQLKKLRYIWLFGFVLILVISGVIIGEEISYENPIVQSDSVGYFKIRGFFTTFPFAIFSYMCHFNILDVYGELRKPTKKRMKRIIFSSTLCAFLLYVLVGVFGYLTFGEPSPNNLNKVILLAYIKDDPNSAPGYSNIILASIFLVCVVVITKAPIYIQPAKDGLKDFFFPKKSDKYGEPVETGESPFVYYSLVILTVYAGVAVAMLGNGIEIATTIIGSTVYPLTCFILPSMFYLGSPKEHQRKFHKRCCWTMLITMAVLGIWNTVENIKMAI